MQIISSNTSIEINPISRQFIDSNESLPEQKIIENSPQEQQVKSESLIKLQKTLSQLDISLKFRTDDKTNAVVVELIDSETGEAINQFPSEVSLKLSASFTKLQGQFIDKQL